MSQPTFLKVGRRHQCIRSELSRFDVCINARQIFALDIGNVVTTGCNSLVMDDINRTDNRALCSINFIEDGEAVCAKISPLVKRKR